MLFLPDYYAIEISYSLPLLTAKRIMLIVFFAYTFKNKRKPISIRHLLSKDHWMLVAYFSIRLFSNLYYVTTYTQPIKTILSLIIEQFLLLVAFHMLNLTEHELSTLFKSIVWSATALFILGIIEALTGMRIFTFLYSVSRSMHNDFYYRLGLIRATASMGMPNLYGNMCAFIAPLIIYLIKTTKEKKYLVIMFLDILATIHSGCRSDLIILALLLLCDIVLSFKKDELLMIAKNVSIVLAMLLVWIMLFSSISNKLNYYYSATIKSVFNLVGFNFDLNAGAPEGVDGYGNNVDGVYSRTFQLSAIEDVLSKNPLFGFGSGCEKRGDLLYLYGDEYYQGFGYDLGIVEVICSEGLIGLLAFIFLFLWAIQTLFKVIRITTIKSKESKLSIFLLLTYLLSTLSTMNMYSFLILIIALLLHYYSINNHDFNVDNVQREAKGNLR